MLEPRSRTRNLRISHRDAGEDKAFRNSSDRLRVTGRNPVRRIHNAFQGCAHQVRNFFTVVFTGDDV